MEFPFEVVCVDASNVSNITEGQTYSVLDCITMRYEIPYWIVVDDAGNQLAAYPGRFIRPEEM